MRDGFQNRSSLHIEDGHCGGFGNAERTSIGGGVGSDPHTICTERSRGRGACVSACLDSSPPERFTTTSAATNDPVCFTMHTQTRTPGSIRRHRAKEYGSDVKIGGHTINYLVYVIVAGPALSSTPQNHSATFIVVAVRLLLLSHKN